MNAEKALDLIKSLGIWGLASADGCNCAHFSVQGLSVGVSCHKSEHCIRVWSDYIYREAIELEPVAREIVRQLAAEGYAGYRVRFCDYRYDHVGGHWEGERFVESYKCCYCDEPRGDAEGYLCAVCQQKREARECYPWEGDGYISNTSEDCTMSGLADHTRVERLRAP